MAQIFWAAAEVSTAHTMEQPSMLSANNQTYKTFAGSNYVCGKKKTFSPEKVFTFRENDKRRELS